MVFGRGRFQNGVLIQPTEEFAFDPSNTQKLVEFRNAIWLAFIVLLCGV